MVITKIGRDRHNNNLTYDPASQSNWNIMLSKLLFCAFDQSLYRQTDRQTDSVGSNTVLGR